MDRSVAAALDTFTGVVAAVAPAGLDASGVVAAAASNSRVRTAGLNVHLPKIKVMLTPLLCPSISEDVERMSIRACHILVKPGRILNFTLRTQISSF